MIFIKLKKHIGTGKMFVTAWNFISKSAANKVTQIPGSQIVLDEGNIPSGFYQNATAYYVESGVVRNGYGINT